MATRENLMATLSNTVDVAPKPEPEEPVEPSEEHHDPETKRSSSFDSAAAIDAFARQVWDTANTKNDGGTTTTHSNKLRDGATSPDDSFEQQSDECQDAPPFDFMDQIPLPDNNANDNISAADADAEDGAANINIGVASAANIGANIYTFVGGGRPSSGPKGFLSEGEQPKERKLESDDTKMQGVDHSDTKNAHDSPPTKRERDKTEDENKKIPHPQTVSRQCPRCRKVLHFRSERTAGAGFKIHFDNCTKWARKELNDVHDPEENVPSCEKPSANGEKPATKVQTYSNFFSVIQNPVVSLKDLNIIKKRRPMVKYPDPRPCFNCTWCGPHLQEDVPGAAETLCVICKSLEDIGWFRWVQERASKKIYMDGNRNRYMSVRAFLEGSTALVGNKLNQMDPEERSSLFSQLHAINERRTKGGASPKKRKAPPKASPNSDKQAKKASVIKGSLSGTVHNEKIPNTVQKKKINNLNGISISAFAKSIVTKMGKDATKSGDLASAQLTSMEKRRGYVCQPDPRPAWWCKWCGVVPQKQNAPSEICYICSSFQRYGWELRCTPTSRMFYITNDSNQKRINSVKELLTTSTEAVCEAMKLLSPANYAELVAKYKVAQLDELDDSQLEEDSPASESDDKSLGEDIPIADLAKSIKSNQMAPLGKVIVSSFDKVTIEKRKQYVHDLDPRPAYGCEWCGMFRGVSKRSDSERKVCPVCMSLREHGWTLKLYPASKLFLSASNDRFNGVKEFLKATTKVVGKAMRKMSRAERSAVQAKYDLTPTGNVQVKAVKKTPVRKRSKSSLSKRSSGTSDVSTKFEEEQTEGIGKTIDVPPTIELPTVSQLLEEKKGLMGVLEADVLQIYNLHFGTNASIAAKILLCLGKGQLPSAISREAPFLRSSNEVKNLSTEASRFVGVFHVKRTLGDGKDEIFFGVAIPQFFANCDSSSQIERTCSGQIVPKVATVNGQPLLLRIGIDDEGVAGKLFSFCYRVMYGSDAVLSIVADRNSSSPMVPHGNPDALPKQETSTDTLDLALPTQERSTDALRQFPPTKCDDKAIASHEEASIVAQEHTPSSETVNI